MRTASVWSLASVRPRPAGPRPAGRARPPWVRGLPLGLAISTLAASLWAQTPTNHSFQVSLLPPANTLMLTQSVQSVFLTIQNLDLFTNVTVTLLLGTNRTAMLDDGNPPDAAATDATYSADLLVPAWPTATNFTVRFLCSGVDLTMTNDLGEPLPGADVTTTNSIVYRAVVRPANDQFASAIKLPAAGGVFFGTNSYATIEPAEPFHGGNPDVAASIWWTWAPALSGPALIDTAGSSFPPTLAVYTGSSLATLRLVAWSTNDAQHGLKANVTFDAVAGVTYRIAVASYDAASTGAVRLNVAPGAAPDTAPPLVAILSPASEALVTTNALTVLGMAKDLPPDATGVTQVRVQLNDDPPLVASGTTNWTASLSLVPGINVISAVAEDLAGNISPSFVIVVRYTNPINDYFATATALPNLAGRVSGDTSLATTEPGEPFHAGNDGGHSVWYYFQTIAPGRLFLSTRGSAFDTLLGVYTGDSLTNLTTFAANDDATPGGGYSELNLNLVPYQTYYIALDGYGGAAGAFQLQYNFTTTITYYSLNHSPPLGGTIVPPAGLYVAGSTQYVTALPARDFEFVRWDGSVTSATNPLALVMTQNYFLSATFRVKSYTEDFEAGVFRGNLTWSTSSRAPWYILREVGGRSAARSGPTGDGQESWLTATATLIDGAAAFDVRVSSEEGWDNLEFYLNDVLLESWTGQLNWRTYQFPVSAGVNTLTWRYAKDANFSAGLDAGFLDNLYLPLPDSSLAAQLTAVKVAGQPDQIQIQVQGQPSRGYVIQASTDFARWTPVFTNSAPSGSFVWFYTLPPDPPARFFRAQVQ